MTAKTCRFRIDEDGDCLLLSANEQLIGRYRRPSEDDDRIVSDVNDWLNVDERGFVWLSQAIFSMLLVDVCPSKDPDDYFNFILDNEDIVEAFAKPLGRNTPKTFPIEFAHCMATEDDMDKDSIGKPFIRSVALAMEESEDRGLDDRASAALGRIMSGLDSITLKQVMALEKAADKFPVERAGMGF